MKIEGIQKWFDLEKFEYISHPSQRNPFSVIEEIHGEVPS